MDLSDRTRDHRLLGATFLNLYALVSGARKHATPLSRLARIKQGPNAMLKLYIKHFNDELTTIHNPKGNGLMMAAMSEVRFDTFFWDKLQKDECKLLS